jgi:thioredoxin reductase-like selenoprotein T
MQIKNIIEQHSTEHINITGEDYPASSEKKLIAKILAFIQMALMTLIIAGSAIFEAIGIPTPSFV